MAMRCLSHRVHYEQASPLAARLACGARLWKIDLAVAFFIPVTGSIAVTRGLMDSARDGASRSGGQHYAQDVDLLIIHEVDGDGQREGIGVNKIEIVNCAYLIKLFRIILLD
jgi:hypothetical protein